MPLSRASSARERGIRRCLMLVFGEAWCCGLTPHSNSPSPAPASSLHALHPLAVHRAQSPSPLRNRRALLRLLIHAHRHGAQKSSFPPEVVDCETAPAVPPARSPGSQSSPAELPQTSAIQSARPVRKDSCNADPAGGPARRIPDYSVLLPPAHFRTYAPAPPPASPVHREESALAAPRTVAPSFAQSPARTNNLRPPRRKTCPPLQCIATAFPCSAETRSPAFHSPVFPPLAPHASQPARSLPYQKRTPPTSGSTTPDPRRTPARPDPAVSSTYSAAMRFASPSTRVSRQAPSLPLSAWEPSPSPDNSCHTTREKSAACIPSPPPSATPHKKLQQPRALSTLRRLLH